MDCIIKIFWDVILLSMVVVRKLLLDCMVFPSWWQCASATTVITLNLTILWAFCVTNVYSWVLLCVGFSDTVHKFFCSFCVYMTYSTSYGHCDWLWFHAMQCDAKKNCWHSTSLMFYVKEVIYEVNAKGQTVFYDKMYITKTGMYTSYL
jgi:hypothetical protein